MGGIFSIGLLIINDTSKGHEERTTSLLVALGGLGGAILPKLVGELIDLIDRFAISVTLWTMVGFAFILVSLMGVIFYLKNKSEQVEIESKVS